MEKETAIKLFESKQVRTVWNDDQEKWYFSIVDIISILTGTERPRKYWSDLKIKLKKEGSELSEKIGQLKMESARSSVHTLNVLVWSVFAPVHGGGICRVQHKTT